MIIFNCNCDFKFQSLEHGLASTDYNSALESSAFPTKTDVFIN